MGEPVGAPYVFGAASFSFAFGWNQEMSMELVKFD